MHTIFAKKTNQISYKEVIKVNIKDLNTDLSIVTTIPKLTLEKLNQNAICCITSFVAESLLDEETITNIDIGIGILTIKVEDNCVKYSFTPNSMLENQITDSVLYGDVPIIKKLEDSIVNKIVHTYKELL